MHTCLLKMTRMYFLFSLSLHGFVALSNGPGAKGIIKIFLSFLPPPCKPYSIHRIQACGCLCARLSRRNQRGLVPMPNAGFGNTRARCEHVRKKRQRPWTVSVPTVFGQTACISCFYEKKGVLIYFFQFPPLHFPINHRSLVSATSGNSIESSGSCGNKQ